MTQNQAMTREARKAAQTRSPQKGGRGQRPKRPLWRRIIRWALLIILAGIVFGGALFFYYAKDAPKLTTEELTKGGSSVVLASNNHQITRLGSENRSYVKSSEIPQQLKDAVVSIEDKRFYSEPLGIDPIRIVSSALHNVTNPNSAPQGGSTLTQQLIKLSYFSTNKSDQTLKRKAQEAWLAMQAQQKYSKEQILEYYINKVFMSNGAYGMGTAATLYYGKSLSQLSLAQTALLAGIPNAPSSYDPYVHPEAAKARRDLVIQAMLENKKITSAQAQEATNTPIATGLKSQSEVTASENNAIIADAYLQEVVKQVKKLGYDPYRDNLTIKTNLNWDAQQHLYDLVNGDSIAFPDDSMQTGVTVTDPNNGNVIAMVGNRKVGQVQMALNHATQTDRSNGSTMKPLLDYAPAIEYLNWATNHTVDDSPYTYPGTNIQLKDWDLQYQGEMTMRQALAVSRNIPAVRTLETVGISKASSFVSNLGIKIASDAGLSVGIGANLSSLQVASAYNAFANGGTYYKPQYVASVTTADKIVHHYNDNEGQTAMKSSTAYMITDMLKDVITSGSGTATQISGLYQAGKTGTTGYTDEEIAKNPALNNTVKDSWFAGYTKHYSIAVWTGYDKSTEQGVANQTIAQLIYRNMMSYLSANVSNSDWSKPSTVVRVGNVLYVKGHQPATTTEKTPSSSSSSSSSESSSSMIESSSSSIESSVSSESSSETTTSTTPDENTEIGENSTDSGGTGTTTPGTGGSSEENSSSTTNSGSTQQPTQ